VFGYTDCYFNEFDLPLQLIIYIRIIATCPIRFFFFSARKMATAFRLRANT